MKLFLEETIQKVSVDATADFMKSSNKSLSKCIAESLQKNSAADLSDEPLRRITAAANHMVNLANLRKSSWESCVSFQLATPEHVKKYLDPLQKDSAGEELGEKVIEKVSATKMTEMPEDELLELNKVLSSMEADAICGRKESTEESLSILSKLDHRNEFAERFFGKNSATEFTRFVEAYDDLISDPETFGEKLSSDKNGLKSLFNFLSVKFYKNSADTLYKLSAENEEDVIDLEIVGALQTIFRKYSADGGGGFFSQIGKNAANVITGAPEGATTEFGKSYGRYAGDAMAYRSLKDTFSVWNRIKAGDVAAQEAIKTGTFKGMGGIVEYGLSWIDKFVHSLSNKLSFAKTLDERKTIIVDIVTSRPELQQIDPKKIADWYESLMSAAPGMSMNRSYVEGFLLQAAGMDAVTTDMIASAVKTEESLVKNRQAGGGASVQFEI